MTEGSGPGGSEPLDRGVVRHGVGREVRRCDDDGLTVGGSGVCVDEKDPRVEFG